MSQYKDFEIKFNFREFASASDLPVVDQKLINSAIEAQNNAYAPYSEFQVGAAVLFSDGTVVIGSNQENAAYPSGLCAERVAIFSANAQFPNKNISKIAIVGGPNSTLTSEPITPCGSCRQVIQETESRQKSPIELILVGKEKIYLIKESNFLLPLSFKL